MQFTNYQLLVNLMHVKVQAAHLTKYAYLHGIRAGRTTQ